MHTNHVRAYGVQSATAPLAPLGIDRREPGSHDVEIDILYCGVCHSDVHTARGEWAGSVYPCVPGHEIVGRVTRVGPAVTKLKQGDLGAVGCMVDSCRTCPSCRAGLEQYCTSFPVLTYNGPDKHLGSHTLGGYSTSIVVDEAFALRVPAGLDLAATAPLLCAGITTYSPLRHWKVGPGQKVGIVGLGGLGHMGVKFARAFGAHVVLFTTSPGPHDLNAYLQLLKLDGTLTLVGAPAQPMPVDAFSMIMPRRNFAGSCIGGIAETQEMLEFCAAHKIVSDIELIPMQQINEAWARMLRQDVRYRFVIDMASLKA